MSELKWGIKPGYFSENTRKNFYLINIPLPFGKQVRSFYHAGVAAKLISPRILPNNQKVAVRLNRPYNLGQFRKTALKQTRSGAFSQSS